jgi:monoamine oxidase
MRMTFTRRDMIVSVAALGATALAAAPAIGKVAKVAKPAAIPDVIVLGAGASGLNAAWLLEQQGLKVLVLEGRKRVGGRVLTLLDQPGVAEMGFNSMAAGYGRGIDAAKRAGVELYDVAPRYMKDPRQQLIIGNQTLTREAWKTSPLNPLPEAYKGMMPWEVVPVVFSKNNPLKDWSDWIAPESAPLDISVHAFLKARGLNDAAVRLVFDSAPYYGSNAYDSSALTYEYNDGWIKAQTGQSRASLAVRGGNQKLTDGMAKLLKGDLLLDKEVVGIVCDSSAATVTCRDGTSYRAKRVVCSLPFSTLRNIAIEPGLSGPQAEAVASLPYQPISIAFLTVREPFWEKDGLPSSIWSDGPLGAVLAQRYGASEDEVTGLSVMARGKLAYYWDRQGREAALAAVVENLARLRPASKGLVAGAAYHSWAMEPFNGGDWAYFAPGQITRFGREMALPAGRLHFCGEHTATANRGIEGAFESSERVALEIISAT